MCAEFHSGVENFHFFKNLESVHIIVNMQIIFYHGKILERQLIMDLEVGGN